MRPDPVASKGWDGSFRIFLPSQFFFIFFFFSRPTQPNVAPYPSVPRADLNLGETRDGSQSYPELPSQPTSTTAQSSPIAPLFFYPPNAPPYCRVIDAHQGRRTLVASFCRQPNCSLLASFVSPPPGCTRMMLPCDGTTTHPSDGLLSLGALHRHDDNAR